MSFCTISTFFFKLLVERSNNPQTFYFYFPFFLVGAVITLWTYPVWARCWVVSVNVHAAIAWIISFKAKININQEQHQFLLEVLLLHNANFPQRHPLAFSNLPIWRLITSVKDIIKSTCQKSLFSQGCLPFYRRGRHLEKGKLNILCPFTFDLLLKCLTFKQSPNLNVSTWS